MDNASATALLAAMKSGSPTAEALVGDLFSRIEAESELNAFSILDRERALDEARRADKACKAKISLGPLHGLPIAIKDNIAVAGLPNTAGTPALANHITKADAPLVTRLRQAGAIIIGKTVMHELAWGTTSINPFSGTPLNPHDRARTAGGSSGGSGAAVAAGLVPIAIGTDTGGSIRIPASMCGVWGFRPSTDRWSSRAIVPISLSRDTAGPLAHSADDLLLLDEAVTGDQALQTLPQPIRIGIPQTYFWDHTQPEVANLCGRAIEILADAGVELLPVDVSEIILLDEISGGMVSGYEGRMDLEAYLEEFAPHLSFTDVMAAVASPDVKTLTAPLLDPNGPFTRDNYVGALAIRSQLKGAYEALFEQMGITALAFPTCNMPAFRLDEHFVDLPGQPHAPVFPAMIHNTGPGSNVGLPGITVPVGKTALGLPVGLSFDGPRMGDAGLLALAKFVEKCLEAAV